MLHMVEAVENEECSENRSAEHEQPSHTASGSSQLHPVFTTWDWLAGGTRKKGGMGGEGGTGWMRTSAVPALPAPPALPARLTRSRARLRCVRCGGGSARRTSRRPRPRSQDPTPCE